MTTYDTGKRCAFVWPETDAPCGGEVMVQRIQTGRGDFRWQVYCGICGAWDPKAYSTLREARRTDYFERHTITREDLARLLTFHAEHYAIPDLLYTQVRDALLDALERSPEKRRLEDVLARV